jgi:uncharacterized protein YbaR (Trm112 family)
MQALQRIHEVLELIVCPVCHGRLALEDAGSAAPASHAVACDVCHRRYPVEDGIPILLESRATRPGV